MTVGSTDFITRFKQGASKVMKTDLGKDAISGGACGLGGVLIADPIITLKKNPQIPKTILLRNSALMLGGGGLVLASIFGALALYNMPKK